MKCAGTTCCNCVLNEFEKLCSLAMRSRECDIDVVIQRLKREISEYESKYKTRDE